jgi:disulfide bond formation protein DsbB
LFLIYSELLDGIRADYYINKLIIVILFYFAKQKMKNTALALAMVWTFLSVYMGLVIWIWKLMSQTEPNNCQWKMRVWFEWWITSTECEYFKPSVPTNIPKYDYIRRYENLQLSCK